MRLDLDIEAEDIPPAKIDALEFNNDSICLSLGREIDLTLSREQAIAVMKALESVFVAEAATAAPNAEGATP